MPKKGKSGKYIGFGEYLKSLRDRSGKSEAQVAITVRTTPSTISRDENGTFEVSPERLCKYAKAYGVPHEALVMEWVKSKYKVDLNQADDHAILSDQEKYLVSSTRENNLHRYLHLMLQWILDHGGKDRIEGTVYNVDLFYRIVSEDAKIWPDWHEDYQAWKRKRPKED